MKLLGTNDEIKTAHDGLFVPYYKKPDFVSEDKKIAVFVFMRKPKYRFVTVPKSTRYEVVTFIDGRSSHIMWSGELVIKDSNIIHVLCFDKDEAA